MYTLLLALAVPAALGGDMGTWLDEQPLSTVYPPVHLPELGPPACTHHGIVDPVQLPTRPDLFVRWDPSRSWGSGYLVDTVVTVAEHMALFAPDADPLMVGDMSRKGGGWMPGHRSHQNGLDVDLGLYFGDGRQPLGGFVDVPPARLDTETTWMLVETLLDTGRIDWILLDAGLIRTLKSYVYDAELLTDEELGRIFPSPATPRLWEWDGFVRAAPGHRDHLHVRVRCEKTVL